MQRSRSLRKPSTRTPDSDSDPAPRTVSPSRLPVKPPSRMPPPSGIREPSTRTASSGLTREPSTRTASSTGLSREPSTRTASSSAPSLPRQPSARATPTAGLARQPGTRTTSLARAPSTRREVEARNPAAPSRTVSSAHARTKSQTAGPADLGPAAGARARSKTGGASDLSPGPGAVAGTRARPAAGPGHARTRSSATGLTSATTLRPPAQIRPQAQASSAAAAPRQVSHTRTRSSAASLSASRGSPLRDASPPKPQSPSQSPPRPARAPAAAAARLKPAFNTNQQHFSPARNVAPKPLTSTFLAPPSPGKLPSNVAISADTLRLQNDLLRHHVLHAAEGRAGAEWHASARKKLGERFEGLAVGSREISREETELLEELNALALRRWGGNLEGKVQGLDSVLSALWRLSEAGGKHARVTRRFERWAERAGEVEDARGRGAILDDRDEPMLVGELDASWKEDCEGLKRKLEGWGEQLRELRVPLGAGEGSNLRKILEGCEELVAGMLSELKLMLEIEEGLVTKEREWVRGVIGSVEDKGTGAGAIWRAL